MKASVLTASGSDETESYRPRDVALISEAIKARGINVVDVIKALARRAASARRRRTCCALVKLRVSGDYLQTSAIVRDGRVISAVNDPNDYRGPGTGYRLSRGAARRRSTRIRDVLDRETVLAQEAEFALPRGDATSRSARIGPAAGRQRPREVVIGVSPAFGVKLFRTLGGIPLSELLQAHGRRHRGAAAARRASCACGTRPTPRSSASRAARLSGSGIGIGIQAKGTAVIHQARPAAAQQSRALLQRADHDARALPRARRQRRRLCAGRDCRSRSSCRRSGEAMGSRYHARVALIYAIETSLDRRRRRAGGDRGRASQEAEHGRRQADGRRLSARGEAARS